jgi:hypothetical protein
LDLHDAGLDVGTDEDEVATVGLDRWAHEVKQRVERLQAAGSFLVRQISHPSSLP